MRLFHKWGNKSLGMVEALFKTKKLEKLLVHRAWPRPNKQNKENLVVRTFKTI